MPRWICAEMDYAHRAHLAFCVGIIKRNKCGGRRKPISFSATRDGGGGFASAKVPSANQRSGVTFRRNALPSFITGHGWPRLPMPGRSSRGCIGKLNLNNRLSLPLQVITLFPPSSRTTSGGEGALHARARTSKSWGDGCSRQGGRAVRVRPSLRAVPLS